MYYLTSQFTTLARENLEPKEEGRQESKTKLKVQIRLLPGLKSLADSFDQVLVWGGCLEVAG